MSATSLAYLPDKAQLRALLSGLANAADPPSAPLSSSPQTIQALAFWLNEHGLVPWFFANGQRYEAMRPLIQSLASVYYASVSNTLIQQAGLQQILADLTAQGVEAVLLKGGALSLVLYPDPALRPMGDFDLWIEKQALPVAWSVAEGLAYHTRGVWPDVAAIPDHVTQLDFYHKAPELCVEFHWDLVSRPQLVGHLPLCAWRERTRLIPWKGMMIRVLDPAAALIHASIHQMYQHWGDIRLIWLYDLDRLIRGVPAYRLSGDDWTIVQEESIQAGVLPAVQEAIRAAAYWFGTPLPEPAHQLLARKPDSHQTYHFNRHAVPGLTSAQKTWFDLQQRPNWWERIRIVAQKLLPRPAYMVQRYQIRYPLLLPFYYLWRWLKMIYLIIKQK